MEVQTYLSFDGRCEEALAFYRETLGAEITTLIHIKDVPEAAAAHPGAGDRVLHSSFRIGETTLCATDGECRSEDAFGGFSLSLITTGDDETERLFGLLADGGQVRMPVTPTFFSSRFGMLADRFGVRWMVLTAPRVELAQAG